MSTQEPAEHDEQDKTLADSFPASDPPANSGITGAEPPPDAPSEDTTDAIPTGTPTSDRHGTETAHHPEHKGA